VPANGYAVELERFLYKENKLTRYGARVIFGNLVKLLTHLRSIPELTFIHSDLKLANMLIDPETGDLFLIDFGLSSITGMKPHRFRTSPDTTKEYAPPECTRCAYHCGTDDTTPFFDAHHIESWQLGLVLYFIVVAPLKREDDIAPFDLESWMRPDINWENVLKMVVGAAKWKSFDREDNALLVSLISGCCARDPHERLTLVEIANHPWVTRLPILKQCAISETILLEENKVD
jgi:serine/threonine protein kinase